MKRRIAIIGGGLAGIAAAVRIAEAGERPILIESRKRLGGRATSLTDPRSGATIDNCQHVLLGCCTNLIDLYDRLHVLDDIEWHRTLHWTAGGREAPIDTIRAGWLPAPLHLARSLRRMTILSRDSKRAISRAMLRMMRIGEHGRLAWRNRTFGEFLNDADQPLEAVRRFWEPIVVSACNMSVDRVGAAFALHVFQEGFLANKWSYTMGLSRVPLARLYDSVASEIEGTGGELHLGISAKAIAFDGRRITGVVTENGFVETSAAIAAVPPDRLEKLCSDVLIRYDIRLQSLGRLKFSPILGVHLWFDQHIMPDDLPHLVVVERDIQWLFNKGVASDGANRIQHLHAVISAADDWMALDEDEIVRRTMNDIHHVLPRSLGLEPIDARAIKEKRAAFAPLPGIDAFRPAAAAEYGAGTGVDNLFLAGDWTDTGWPATMEGAVRSGYTAAHAALQRLNTSGAGESSRVDPSSAARGGLVEDVPTGLLARVLGLR
ncbi:MAG TPA: hydroxysqualene dehydroxylase HpnE [Phycisphaerales bacterium]|nr:hydroxysqualene dehydroxylase HpnE [Phycisphaerales bacterium]